MRDVLPVIPTVGPLTLNLTDEDVEPAKLVGATLAATIVRSIHSQLDEFGVPREGRMVRVTQELETITFKLPPGWYLAQPDGEIT